MKWFNQILLLVALLCGGCIEITVPDNGPSPNPNPSPAPDNTPVDDTFDMSKLVAELRKETGGNKQALQFYAAYYDILSQRITAGRYATAADLEKVTLDAPGVVGYASIKESCAIAGSDVNIVPGSRLDQPGPAQTQVLTMFRRLAIACRKAS